LDDGPEKGGPVGVIRLMASKSCVVDDGEVGVRLDGVVNAVVVEAAAAAEIATAGDMNFMISLLFRLPILYLLIPLRSSNIDSATPTTLLRHLH